MARPSPLITACLGVGVLVLGVEVAAIYRSHDRPPVQTVATAPEEPDPAPPTAPANPPPTPPPAAAPNPAPNPAPAAVAPAAEPPGPLAVGDVPVQWRRFTVPDMESVIRKADEEVFEKLEIPEATRASIRRLNEEHQQKLHALRAGEPGVTNEQQLNGNRANITAFTQTRREGLQEILGPDTEIRFERAERAATKHLRNQLRAEALGGVSPSVASPAVQ
jgi:hypothetical protein